MHKVCQFYLGAVPVFEALTLELPVLEPATSPPKEKPTYSNAELLAKIASLERQIKIKEESHSKLDALYQKAIDHNRYKYSGNGISNSA